MIRCGADTVCVAARKIRSGGRPTAWDIRLLISAVISRSRITLSTDSIRRESPARSITALVFSTSWMPVQ